MALKIRWLGVSGFEIITEKNLKVYIDPYLDRRIPFNPPPITSKDVKDADAVLITHGHFDHFEDTPKILRQTNAKLIASHEICRFAEDKLGISKDRLIPFDSDEMTNIKDVTITATKGIHMSSLVILQLFLNDFSFQPKSREEYIQKLATVLPSDVMAYGASTPSGPLQGYFIVTEQGFRIWNTSETVLFDELREYCARLKPQIALVPVLGKFWQDSARLVNWMSPRVVIVHGFDKLVENQPVTNNFQDFQKAMDKDVNLIIPRSGETFEFDVNWKKI
jgi:L-ascorbate metabolism protein UlaG (beta-lactamase superfamily)